MLIICKDYKPINRVRRMGITRLMEILDLHDETRAIEIYKEFGIETKPSRLVPLYMNKKLSIGSSVNTCSY